MDNLSRLKNESLINYADRIAELYNKTNTRLIKKGKGQFFTPPPVARYMAKLGATIKKEISILDPGAGLGILSVSLLQKLANEGKVRKVNLICYETDKIVLPYLEAILKETKKILSQKLTLQYSIFEDDFVSSNVDVLKTNIPNDNNPLHNSFDFIISNPPYFKISRRDLTDSAYKSIVSGQPNIYYLFMAISARLLDNDGEMIFITPRSFCSGLYYNKFRKWLTKEINISHIHIFDSRKELFSKESVLQENIITKFTKKKVNHITISKTYNGDFSQIEKIDVLNKDVIYRSNGHIYYRIPSNKKELEAARKLDQLPHNFFSLGIKISTGKVVAFRNRKYLQNEVGKDSVPLLWMHNIQGGRIKWPSTYKNKAVAIKNTPDSEWLFHEPGNYLVMKRFTPKELKKRFVTACIFKEDFEKYGFFALDNMMNYIYAPDGELSRNQIKGIARYLNLPIVDLYFRILNGHTQVNANEVYSLPFPSLDKLEMFGNDKNSEIGVPSMMQDKQTPVDKNNKKELLYA